MKIILGLIAVVMMSACSHMGHHDHASSGCSHCEKSEASGSKEKCKNGCSH